MDAFVFLALAVAVLSIGLVGVAVAQAVRVTRRLLSTMRAASERIRPLTEELEREAAVAGTEGEALERRLAAGFRRRGRPPG